jgi:hypothetical protein
LAHGDAYDLGLDPGMQNFAAISERSKPYDVRLMEYYPISSRINNVANDDEECARPVEITEGQSSLFRWTILHATALFDSFGSHGIALLADTHDG